MWFSNDMWFIRPGGMFRILVNMGVRVRYRMFKNTVCRTTHKNCEQQKPGVSKCSLLYNLTQLINV
jgi:hypothetical protein